ncbi:MAG: hypothetical protein C4297_10640 [Gemmataceae bacterium]
MTARKVTLAAMATLVLWASAWVAQRNEPAGTRMMHAATRFLAALTAEQRQKAVFAFDHPERFNWHFVPLEDAHKRPTRKGLAFEEMNQAQRESALALLRSGTSSAGYRAATTIMSLEAILHELEKGKGPVRNPDWYFVTIFGDPSKDGPWGWRIEGHHLSVNFTLQGDKVIAATPCFFGANPATVMYGERKGLRTLPLAEDLALELFRSLQPEQRRVALQSKHFPEVSGRTRRAPVSQPVGLPASRMSEAQRDLLLKLIADYTQRLPEDIATYEMARIRKAGIETIHFAFAGGERSGVPHTYRIQGPTFVIEFLNVQNDSAGNPANHIHSCYRSLPNDFGLES